MAVPALFFFLNCCRMAVSDKIAARYAEIYVSAFERIIGDPSSPFLSAGGGPQCSVDGKPFRGGNALSTSVVAAERGFGIPYWLTRSKIQDWGLLIRPGERNTPICHYDVFYEDVATKKRDPQMNDILYAVLPEEERKKWVKRCYLNCYPEFNVAQTNFNEVYPESWDALVEKFGSAEKVFGSCSVLDGLIDAPMGVSGSWLCPVRLDGSQRDRRPGYDVDRDEIVVGPKSAYADERRWYCDLVHEMAHSTGSECRMERDIYGSSLNSLAREELVAELAGSIICTMVGLQPCIQEHNLGFLKSWCEAIGGNPSVIYLAVNDAARAADMISSTLGLELKPGFDLDRMMGGVEQAQKAQAEAQQRREARRKASCKNSGSRKVRRFVKAARSGGRGI